MPLLLFELASMMSAVALAWNRMPMMNCVQRDEGTSRFNSLTRNSNAHPFTATNPNEGERLRGFSILFLFAPDDAEKTTVLHVKPQNFRSADEKQKYFGQSEFKGNEHY